MCIVSKCRQLLHDLTFICTVAIIWRTYTHTHVYIYICMHICGFGHICELLQIFGYAQSTRTFCQQLDRYIYVSSMCVCGTAGDYSWGIYITEFRKIKVKIVFCNDCTFAVCNLLKKIYLA